MRLCAAVFALLLAAINATAPATAGTPDAPPSPTPAVGASAGKIFRLRGAIYRGLPEIRFARPATGSRIALEKEDSDRTHPVPVSVTWLYAPRRLHSRKLNPLPAEWREREALKTDSDSSARALLEDGTAIELGEKTVLELARFEGKGAGRFVRLRLAQGRIHVTIASPVERIGQFTIETPNAVLHHRGKPAARTRAPTELIVEARDEGSRVTSTRVLCVRGQVSAETFQPPQAGLVYANSHVIQASEAFSASGRHGLGLNVRTRAVSKEDAASEVARFGVLR